MSAILETYARRSLSFSHGKGCYLFSTSNEKYLEDCDGEYDFAFFVWQSTEK